MTWTLAMPTGWQTHFPALARVCPSGIALRLHTGVDSLQVPCRGSAGARVAFRDILVTMAYIQSTKCGRQIGQHMYPFWSALL